jgi:hypothetical protein
MSRDKFSVLSDLKDLPEELKKELNLDTDPDLKIVKVFQEGGGTLNLSEVLIGYFRIHGEVKSRRFMMSACHRMVRKKTLRATGKKGEYELVNKNDVANEVA